METSARFFLPVCARLGRFSATMISAATEECEIHMGIWTGPLDWADRHRDGGTFQGGFAKMMEKGQSIHLLIHSFVYFASEVY